MKDHGFIFDMDGVIVDSNPYHKVALIQFCEKHGAHLSEEDLRTKVYGRTNKEWIKSVFGNLSPEKMAEYEDEKESLYRKLFQHDIKPIQGLIAFLEKSVGLAIPRAIGTSAPRINVDFTLSKTGTTRFFDHILDQSHVTHGKPDPEIYMKCAASLRLPPEQCIVFEDSLSGVESGRRAGCKVVGITTTHSGEELTGASYIIDDFQTIEPQTLIKAVFGVS